MVLGILPHKYTKGFKNIASEEDVALFSDPQSLHTVVSLKDMMDIEFPTDAHFTCYNLPGFPAWPRLNKPAFAVLKEEGCEISLDHFAFDYDTGTGEGHIAWTNDLILDFCNKIETLTHPVLSQWSALYTTKRGARLIYTLSNSIDAETAEGCMVWMVKEFQNAGFHTVDTSCTDWTRLFRCPRVMRDGMRSSDDPFFVAEYREGKVLDIKQIGSMPKTAIAVSPRKRDGIPLSQMPMPPITGIDEYLTQHNVTSGRPRVTEFYKKAKKHLKDCEYFDILFNSVVPNWTVTGRNNAICHCLGVITPILLRKTGAMPQQIFALMMNPVLTLGDDQDWPAHTWKALVDIFTREEAKLNLEREEEARKVSHEIEVMNRIVEGMKQWDSAPELYADPETARQYASARLIVMDGNYNFFMGENGFYMPMYYADRQTIPYVRNSYLKDIIQTEKEAGNGNSVDLNHCQIHNKHGIPVPHVALRVTKNGQSGYLEYEGEQRTPILVLNMFRRNPLLKPTYNPLVDKWLECLAGNHYDDLVRWIGLSLAFEEGPICALSLEAPPGIGKLLLIQGLAETLEHPKYATDEVIEKQCGDLQKTPFLYVNEGWPTLREKSPSEAFKKYVSGDIIQINDKYKPMMHIHNNVRVIMTANNPGMLQSIMNSKNQTYDDRHAIGTRLFHIKVGDGGAHFLNSIGNNLTTRKEGAKWITPEGGGSLENDFIVAKHFLWLYENREKSEPTRDRFLMMGNCAPGSKNEDILSQVLSENPVMIFVSRACVGMLDIGGPFNAFMRINDTQDGYMVTREGVQKYIREVMAEKVRDSDIKAALQSLMIRQEPELINGVAWYDLNIDTLVRFVTEYGIEKSRVRTLAANKFKREAGIEDGVL